MTDPLLRTPSGKPRARACGIPFDGQPGRWNAITDALAPVFAGFHSQNGNGEMTGKHMIEEGGIFALPVTITNTHACGIARDAIVRMGQTTRMPAKTTPGPLTTTPPRNATVF